MKKPILLLLALAALLVTMGGLAGCSQKPAPSPVPTAPEVATPTIATATPGPTATPSVTPTPLPPQPPRLLGRSPERGEEQPPTGPLVLRFDQPMNEPSLQQALRIEPAVEGAISWDDPATMRFTPAGEGFLRDTAYRVTVDDTAQSAQKLPLPAPIEFRFQTVGNLEASDVFPQAGAGDVPTDSVIRIIFNRPVVPLTGVTQPAAPPAWLKITPATKGTVLWTNTSILTFQPEGRLLPGTKYTVAIQGGLQDVTGGLMAKDFSWSFTTALPAVIFIQPQDGVQYVSPNAAVRLTFNQPMNRAATQERFSLTQARAEATTPGRFAWEGDTLVFTPTQPLEMGGLYDIQLAQGAPSLTGDAATAEGYAWSFQVAGLPGVADMMPSEGATNVKLDEPWQIAFTGPISESTLLKGLVISPTAQPYIWWENEDTLAHVAVQLKPSTAYTVTLTSNIVGRYGQRLAEPVTVHFRTGPYDPSIQFNVPDRVGSYNAYARPTVYLNYRNISRVSFRLYTLSVEDLVALNQDDGWTLWQQYKGKQADLLRSWSATASAPLNETGTFSTTLTEADGRALEPGLYYLEATAPEVSSPERHMVIVSDTNLTLKSTQNDAFIWATDLRDGLPVAGVKLSLYGGKGQVAGEATTDKDGIARISFPQQDSWMPLIVLGRRGEGITAVIRSWSQGLQPWDFGLNSASSLDKYRGFFYTERQIYRPGQTVYFKGIVRADDDGRYSLPPANTPVQVLINDSQGRQLSSTKLTLNEMGTVNGQFDLGPDAALGYYSLQASYNNQTFYTDFQVAEYRKPEFQVQVSLDKADYIQGDRIQATAEATFFFGGPVSKSRVHWRVMAQPYFFDRYQGKVYYEFTDYDDEFQSTNAYGNLLTEGDGQTDAQGRFTFSIPADVGKSKQSQTYVVEVSVVDLNNQEVSANATAVVHKGNFYIGLAPTSYVGQVGQPQTVQVITVDTQGRIVPNQALQVVFNKHEWYSVQQLADDGNYYWASQVRDTPVATQTVKTDAQGLATATFTPSEGGVYRVLAMGKDQAGNQVRSSAYLWVSAEQFVPWRQENNDRIVLVADKKSYKPGETAQILIPSPYQGTTTALLTIERGTVLEHRLIQLKSNSERLSLPIPPEYAPNVYVGVVIIKGMDKTNPVPGFKVGYVMLAVSTEQKELAITITPDRTIARPRDVITYQIQARDYQGRGVQAELSLQLVDLAVESLVGVDARDIVQEFYRQRGLGVSTATTLAVSVDRRNLERTAGGKGGGGGGPGEGPTVREVLPDTAFWAPTVRTDSSGAAKVSVTLPDNLTTWRMRAQAVTAQTEVGKATQDITTTLEILVRPVVPRFMVIGDRPVLGAVVQNNTAQDLKMAVTLAARGVSVQNAAQSVVVPAHDRVALSWPAVVSETEQAVLRYTAINGVYSDAIEITLPVYHPSTPETVGTSGEVADRAIELVRLPQQIDPALGELSVLLEPSLAAGMQEGLRYLQTYPYDCIEQTVSRFLPNVLTYRALAALKISRPDLEAALPQQVGNGLQRIYTLQNPDGGWGWWANEASSPILSAYVILGMAEARRAQFSVDQGTLDRGLAYLKQWLEQQKGDTPNEQNDEAMVLYALAEAGEGDLGRTVALYENREGMRLYARGLLLMALQILDPKETSRLTTLSSELAGAAILSATSVHWEEDASYDLSMSMNTDIRTTAILLRALLRVGAQSRGEEPGKVATPQGGDQPPGSSPLLPNAVRWLMDARTSGRWETTQENAWSIMALTDYMVSTGELTAAYSYDLLVNGAALARGNVTPQSVDTPISAQKPIADLRAQGDNDVIMDRTKSAGQPISGQLYYSIFLRYFLPADRIAALNRGIFVSRQYTLAGAPSKPISAATVNDTIVVTLTLIVPHDLYAVVVEDPLPAGCEAVDTSLLTTSRAAQGPEVVGKGGAEIVPWQWYWASHVELHDERVALFSSYLPAGTYEYSYSLRATTPGEYKVMPTTAYEMYFPDVFGRSAGAAFTIAAGK